MPSHRFQWNFASLKGLLQNSKRQTGFCFGFFRGVIRPCGFRLFDSSKYLTTLRSNISRCQKATTLILITLYNPSFHLWKSSKNYLGTSVFLFWIPFKICDSDKFLLTTPVTQFLLQAVTWQNKPTFFRSLYKMIDQERLKMLKTFEIFCRNGKFDNLTSSLPANFLWWNPKT